MSMTLTKNDLDAIRGVMKEELVPTNKRIDGLDKKISSLDSKVNSLDKKVDRNFIFLKKRFDELFNFAEVREVQTHLHLSVSEF